jgi:hypothetical protein
MVIKPLNLGFKSGQLKLCSKQNCRKDYHNMSLFARSFYFGIQIDNIEGKLESIVSHLDLNVNNIAAHERFALAYDLPSLKDQGIT